MTPEDLARRYGIRPGYRLVSYREVGLPLWNVNLRCQVRDRVPLSPIDEFILKSIDAGLNSSEDVSEFLGLPSPVVVAAMARLVERSSITPIAATSNQKARFVLTARGRTGLIEASEVSIQEVILQVPYDGLLRRFVGLANLPRYEAHELRILDLLELPPFPSDPPTVGPSSVNEVAEVVGRLDMSEEVRRDLIAVLGTEGRRRFFVRAIALVFEAIEHREVLVDFVVDGRPSADHSEAFARAEGVRKLGIMQSLRASAAELAAQSIIPHLTADLARNDEVAALRQTTEVLRSELADLEERVETAGEDVERERLVNRAEETSEKLRSAEASLSSVPVRSLEVYEHPPLLRQALAEALERLLIVSPWIRAGVVDRDFLEGLEDAAKRGVEIALGYGSGADEGAFERDKRAEDALGRMADNYPNVSLVKLGDTHAKVLVLDRRYVVVTSFNWLSFKGDPDKPFRDERGMLVTLPDEIDRIYESFRNRMALRMDELGT